GDNAVKQFRVCFRAQVDDQFSGIEIGGERVRHEGRGVTADKIDRADVACVFLGCQRHFEMSDLCAGGGEAALDLGRERFEQPVSGKRIRSFDVNSGVVPAQQSL